MAKSDKTKTEKASSKTPKSSKRKDATEASTLKKKPTTNTSDVQSSSSSSSITTRVSSNHVKIIAQQPNPSSSSSSSSKQTSVLVCFPSNMPLEPLTFQTTTTSRHVTSLTGTSPTCTYTTQVTGAGAGALTHTIAGDYDKINKTLTLHINDSKTGNFLYPLKQTVTDYISLVTNDSLQDSTLLERRNLLYNSFGSSKKLKVLKSQQANQVTMDSVLGGDYMLDSMDSQTQSKSNADAILAIASGGTVDTVAIAMESARRALLPDYDLTAQVPFDVYNAKNIVGEEAWSQIERQLKAIEKSGDDWKTALVMGKSGFTTKYPEFILDVIKRIKSLDDKTDKRCVKTLMFLRHLFVFHMSMKKQTIDSSPSEYCRKLNIPDEVGTRIFELFSIKSSDRGDSYGFTKVLTQKRVVHMSILYLLSTGGANMKNSDITKFVTELQMQGNDVAELLRQAGCLVKKGKGAEGGLGVELKLPLVFPGAKRGRK